MGKVSVDLSGKDNLSPALKSASARLVELRSEIEQLRAKGKIDITVADTRNLAKLTNEAARLEKQLDSVGSTGVKGANSLKSAFAGLDKVLGQIGLGGFAGALTGAGFAAATVQVGKMAVELGNLGQQVQQQRDYFEVWSGGVAAATTNLEAMRRAVGGALTESEMMAGANRLLSMGLADNSNELETMSRMAVMLGGSTRTAAESIEEFSLLLANQSILRLDTFGISGAKVRERIEELMAADKNLTREQAFLNAVMEEGTRKVDALEAAGVKATTATQDLGTAFRGLKEAIGEVLAQPIEGVETGVATFFANLTAAIQAGSADAGIQLTGLNAQLRLAQAELATLEAQPLDPGDEFGTAAARMAELRSRINDLYDALVKLTPANEAVAASSGVAAVRMVDSAREVQGAVGDVNAELSGSSAYWDAWAGFAETAAQRASNAAWAARSAMGQVAQAATTTGTFTEPSKTRWGLFTDFAKKQVSSSDAGDLVRQWQERMEKANKDIAGRAGTDYASAMKEAARQVQSDVEGALSGAISASKGLFDFTKGAGDLFAPGSNGPFEAIFRAQSIAVHGTGGANEQKWAQMYGLTQESAKKIVADFQKGLFTQDVQGLINVDQLVGQIQSEQAAGESKTAFANMIAGKLGVKDAGALVASQTFQAISGGVDADPTQQAGAAQKVLDAYLNNVNAVVTGKDYAGRMIGFGTTSWVYYETGLLEGAKSSAVFASAVDAAIGAWMARQAAPKQQGVVGASNAMGVTP
jgi:hypothetical protein